ncbi:hypothetical protein DL771_008606 [Monosporascus sp. 5C6A]|nr:hypothetical protein DL771_008606 [Monosporascus sp. 5C6A]
MANVTLDSQTFFTFPLAADRKSTSRNLWARDGDSPVGSSRGSKTPQHDTDDPQRGAGGASQDDAVLISSDGESDYGDLDDGISDIFPSIEELLAAGRKDVEPGSVAGIDKSLSATPGAVGNSDAVEPSFTEGANTDDEVVSTLPRPSSASPGPLQVEQNRPIPAGSASSEAEQASAPKNRTCGKPDWRISGALPPGVDAQYTPSPSRLSGPSLPRLEEGTDRESIPRRNSGGESDSDDEAGPPLAKPKYGGRSDVIGHGVYRSLGYSRVDAKDKDEVVQQSDG